MSEEDYLSHHGIKGMKWGVRHDRPKLGIRKRVRSAGTNLKRLGKTTSEYVENAKMAYKKNRLEILKKKMATDYVKAQKAEQKKLRSKDSRKARQLALSTHDPKILYKNAHLLTDDELRERYNRLSLENEVHKLYVAQDSTGFKNFQKKADWAMNTPIAKAGIEIGKKAVSKKLGLDSSGGNTPRIDTSRFTSGSNANSEALRNIQDAISATNTTRQQSPIPSYSKSTSKVKIAGTSSPRSSKYTTVMGRSNAYEQKPHTRISIEKGELRRYTSNSDSSDRVPIKVASVPKKSKKNKYSQTIKK